MTDSQGLVRLARSRLQELADPGKAAGMQAYMRTEMPFYGVQKPARETVLRELVHEAQPDDRDDYEAAVLSLWEQPHREEKYLAIGLARRLKPYVVPDSLPIYRQLIVEGAWWDLVDEVATQLVGDLVARFPGETWPVVDTWVGDPDLWLRRTAIICQVGAKTGVDEERLFRYCAERAFERDFFIRKAIGWALRDHARVDPDAVAGFVLAHRDELSSLSFREATKHIGHLL